MNIDLYKLSKNNTNKISIKKPNNLNRIGGITGKIFNLKDKNNIPNSQLSIFRNYRTENKNDRIYSIDQKKINGKINENSFNNYEISKTLNKVRYNKIYNNNKGKRQIVTRNLMHTSLTQNNNNKTMNNIILKYKNTRGVMKETKNSINFSKYTFNDNENKNEFTHKKINEKMYISPLLGTAIPMNKSSDKLKNKHIKINIRKKSTNPLGKNNFNINFNGSKNKDQKEIINNFEKNNGENEIKTSIKGKDSINKIVTNLFEPIKLKNDKYFSNLKKINNTNYNSYYKNEKNKITNNGSLSRDGCCHKRSIKNKILKLDINNNINFTSNNNLKNIINICNSKGSIKFPYKNEKITKYDNKQIEKYDSNTNIYLTIPLKYEKIPKNNLSNNKIKEIKKTMYSTYNQIKNLSLNRFIHNNEKIRAYLNQLDNKKLQNNSKVINSSKKNKNKL